MNNNILLEIEDLINKKKIKEAQIELSKLGKFKGVTPRLLPSLLSTKALRNDSLVQSVIEMAADVGQVNFTLQQEAIMGRPDFRTFAQNANMPVEILVGDEDQLTPTYFSEELDSLFSHSNLTILPDVGHLTSMEAPDQVTDVLTKLVSSV